MSRRKIGKKIGRRLTMDRQLFPESVSASECLPDNRSQEERKESKRQTIAPEDITHALSPQPTFFTCKLLNADLGPLRRWRQYGARSRHACSCPSLPVASRRPHTSGFRRIALLSWGLSSRSETVFRAVAPLFVVPSRFGIASQPGMTIVRRRAVGQPEQAFQFRSIADQIELETLVAQPSQLLLDQNSPNHPLAIHLRNCIVWTVGQAEHAAPRKNLGAFT